MKRVSLFLVIVLLSVFFVSCGGSNETTLTNDNSTDTEGEREIRLSLPQCDVGGIITGSTVDDIGALSVKVLDSRGEKQWSQSYSSSEIINGMEISGIPNVNGGQLVVMGFSKDNNNVPKWLGKATNVTFEKGVETKVTMILYPIDGALTCLPQKMNIGRFGHTATPLPDGRILLAGGFVSSSDVGGNTVWNATDSVELLDLETGTVERLAAVLSQPRAMHTAFALPDGSVILVGGVRKMSLVAKTVPGYPSLPVSYDIPVTSVERFTPSYPKYNLVINGRGGAPQPAKTENLLPPDDSVFLTYQSYDVVEVDKNNFKVYISGGLSSDGLLPSGTVTLLAVGFVDATATIPATVTATVTEFGTAEGSLLPSIGSDITSMVTVGGHPHGASSVGQKLSPAPAAWGVSLTNIFSGSQVRTDQGNYSFGGMELKCTSDTDCSISDSKKVYELFPSAAGERAGSLVLAFTYMDVVYVPAFSRFMMIGGSRSLLGSVDHPVDGASVKLQPGDGIDLILKLDRTTLKGDTWYTRLNAPHLLSRTVVSGESTLIITGGVTALGDGGESLTDIEIVTIQK
ncbi:hypothetical protein KAH37_02375 [bacterium]|nr:hypothetical protein [bacterium]